MSDIGEQKYLTTKVNETADVLRRARALVDTPEKWCGNGAADEQGRICMMVALNEVTDLSRPESDDPYMFLCHATDDDIPGFNDTHEHDEVMAAFDRAILLAEQQ